LAISLEEEDERIYADYAEGLRSSYPASAAVFDGMREEESSHRARLLELYRQRFGEHIPLIRRQEVRGFVQRRPSWLVNPLRLDACSRLRCGVCDAADADRVRRRIGGVARGWYQHGVRRSVVRRRHTNGSRTSVGAGVDHRTHDRAGRPRTYASIPDRELPDRDDHGGGGSSDRAGDDHLDPASLYGHADGLGRAPGRIGWGAGVRDWSTAGALLSG